MKALGEFVREVAAGLLLLFIAGSAFANEPADSAVVMHSVYIRMSDGVRLAADVYLPRGERKPLPTVLLQTPYHRSRPGILADANSLVQHDYAYVALDLRGSGASFGVRRTVLGSIELNDGVTVLNWITAQPWSNGVIGLEGVSYEGWISEMLMAQGNPAVKAVMPMFTMYDEYPEIQRPGGILLERFLRAWTDLERANDSNTYNATFEKLSGAAEPVNGDVRAMREAVSGHRSNFDLYATARATQYKDDVVGAFSPIQMSPYPLQAQVRAAGAPIYSVTGWYDGGFIYGAIKRFLTTPTPGSHLIIGPWAHGGAQNISPCAKPDVGAFDARAQEIRFLDRYLKGIHNELDGQAPVMYYTLCEEAWHSSQSWPPAATHISWYLAPDSRLSSVPPSPGSEYDRFQVDNTASSGKRSRWVSLANLDRVVIGYPDRAGQKNKVIAWESPALAEDTEVTGHPLATLELASDRPQVQLFVYLEDVGPDGTITYVTEGELDPLHRLVDQRPPPYKMVTPYRSFFRADSRVLAPGQIMEAVIDLWPTSYLFRAGHRVRVSIAGADVDNFEKPTGPEPTLRFYRNRSHATRIVLPVVMRQPS